VSIKPTTFLPVREGHSISALAPGHEHDLAASAHAVDGEKHFVPRNIGACTRDLFEVAGMVSVQHGDHLIFHGRMLCHAPYFGEQNELLQEQECIVGATGWCRRLQREKFGSTGSYRLRACERELHHPAG